MYSHFHDKMHYIDESQLPDRREFIEYFAGIDWGWRAPPVFLLLGKTADGKTYLLEEHSASKTHMEFWQDLATKWMREYGRNMPFYCDSSEQDRIDKLTNRRQCNERG